MENSRMAATYKKLNMMKNICLNGLNKFRSPLRGLTLMMIAVSTNRSLLRSLDAITWKGHFH